MAEFCLDCWNALHNRNDTPDMYVISKYLDLCEGGGEFKHVVLERRHSFFSFFTR